MTTLRAVFAKVLLQQERPSNSRSFFQAGGGRASRADVFAEHSVPGRGARLPGLPALRVRARVLGWTVVTRTTHALHRYERLDGSVRHRLLTVGQEGAYPRGVCRSAGRTGGLLCNDSR